MNYTANASTTIDAPAEKVWRALTTPDVIKQYMFGTTVASDFQQGSPITWKGEWQGKTYEDHGVIEKAEPNRLLRYTHESGGESHVVTVELHEEGGRTRVSLAQDNNASEEARQHSEANWRMMLEGLKKVVEQ